MISLASGRDAQLQVERLLAQEQQSATGVQQAVAALIEEVRTGDGETLQRIAARFGDEPGEITVSRDEIEQGAARVSGRSREVLERAAGNIRRFADAVRTSLKPFELEMGGHSCGMDYRPVASVGCYVPGGRFPLPSTALMTAISARSAGVGRVVMVSPRFPDEVLLAAQLAGVDECYRIGGAQAVAALAFGCAPLPQVDMVVGPGNAYVTEAKRQLSGRIGIDMLAGPSEVGIIADAQADAGLVALDMLAQLEHDPDARAWLLTDSEGQARDVQACIERELGSGVYPAFIASSLGNSALIVLQDLAECCRVSDRLAAEHLQLHVADPLDLKQRLSSYGALFLGGNATVPFGDYMSGPNHTLPTGGSARFSGGLSPLSFLRPQSWLSVDAGNSALARDTADFARLENLLGHARAAQARDALTTVS